MKKPFIPGALNKSTDVFNEIVHAVLLYLRRFGRQVVATHVGSHSLVMPTESGKLVLPVVSEPGRIMAEH